MTENTSSSKGQAPRYKLTDRAYLNDTMYEKGAEITWHEPPAWYMEPINASAKEQVKKHKPVHTDPINTLTIINQQTTTVAA